MATFPIIEYGDGQLFREYFNSIVAFFGTSDFNTLINLTSLLAVMTVCYSFISKRSILVLIQWLGIFYLGFYILFTPRVTVTIIDRINGDMGYPVDNVPFGLAVIASYTSLLDDALTQSLESTFTTPDYMPYHETGMVFASRLMTMANQFEISDAEFDENLNDFIHQCVFYDILLNKYSINDLVNSKDVWGFVSANASPARAFLYKGAITTCKEGSLNLSYDWQNVITNSIQDYSQRLYPNLSQQKAKTQMLTDLPISYSYLTKISASAQEIMQQNLMANAIQRGVVGLGAKLDASAALESYTYARAEEQKRLTNKSTGEMAAEWLPKLKIAIEAILYGSFIFIVLLSVFPFGGMVVKNYLYSLIWVHLWSPLYAILNLMISWDAQSKSIAATSGGLSLKNMSGLLQINSDIAGLAGGLSIAVPFLVTGIVFGMHKALSHGLHQESGITQAAIGAGVNEAVTGNISFGNTSLGNQHANNISSNHVNTSGQVSAGSMNSQLVGGSNLTTSADGSHILDMKGGISNLGASINLMDGLRSSYSKQVEKATSAAINDNMAFSEASTAAVRQMNDLSHNLGKTTSSGEGWSVSTNAGASQAIHENDRLTQEYADRHHVSYHEAASVLASAYADGKVSGGVGAGGGIGFVSIQGGVSGGTSRSASHSDGTDKGRSYSDANNYIHDTNYSRNVDTISRAVKDHSLRFSNDEANRLVSSIGASLDKADNARHDMQSHYQEAQSARENANRVEEHAATIQVNGNQEFNKWLENQPGTNGQGKMGARSIEAINKDPNLSQAYANQFIEQYKGKVESNWNHQIPTTNEAIKHQYHVNNQKIPSLSSIEETHHANVKSIEKLADHETLRDKNLIDTTPKKESESMIANAQNAISKESTELSQQSVTHKAKVDGQESKKRHEGLYHDMFHGIKTNDE